MPVGLVNDDISPGFGVHTQPIALGNGMGPIDATDAGRAHLQPASDACRG